MLDKLAHGVGSGRQCPAFLHRLNSALVQSSLDDGSLFHFLWDTQISLNPVGNGRTWSVQNLSYITQVPTSVGIWSYTIMIGVKLHIF